MSRNTTRTGAALVAAVLAMLLTACGGGSDQGEVLDSQCFVAGQAAPDSACAPTAGVQPVNCSNAAAGVCQ